MRTLVGTLPPPMPHRKHRLGLVDLLREVRAESRKVVPPSLRELLTYSAISLLWAAVMMAFVVALDVVVTKVLLHVLT